MSRFVRTTFSALLLLAIAAPTLAPAQSTGGTGYNVLWKKGSKMEAAAIKRLAQSQAKLAKADNAIVAAKNLQVASADAGMVSGTEFRQIASTPPALSTSVEARDWAKKVADAAKRWTDADKRGVKGGKNLDRAIKNKGDAEAAIIRSKAEIEQGRAIMADAQRIGG
jgi:uncharacterized cupredoxin-like copper-binding protein